MPATSRSGGDRSVGQQDCFPSDGLPTCPFAEKSPEWEVWNSLIGRIPAQILRRADLPQLKLLCECTIQSDKLYKVLQDDPLDHKTGRMWMNVAAHISRLSAQFGLSPIDRRRLKFDVEQADEFSDWMNDTGE